jgi:hypothetical protein
MKRCSKNDATKKEAEETAKLIRKSSVGERKYDKKAILALALLLETGKYKEAYKHYWKMDTFVREAVPEVALRFLFMNRASTKLAVDAFVTLKGVTKVFRPGLPPGCVAKYTWGIPGDATKEEMARWIFNWQEKTIRETVEVKMGKVRKV